MSDNYINSDEVNSVPFPGAEEGTSLVQLVGEVSTTASISSITLRLLAVATVVSTAQASGIAPKVRFGVEPTTTATAEATATARSKVHLYPATEVAAASTTVNAICLRKTGGTGVATAEVASPVSQVVVTRSASATAAAVGTATSVREWPVEAVSSGQAIPASVGVLAKTYQTAITSAVANWSVLATEKLRVGATASAQAGWSINATVHQTTGASTMAEALVSSIASASFDRVSPDPATAQATASDISIRMKIGVYPVVSATAECQAVNAIVVYRVGATTIATVSSAIAAADYSATLPAPLERTMVVSPIIRRMEVTE